MAEKSLHSFTASDGYAWTYRRFAPRGKSRGSLIMLHGIQSHGGWYETSAQAMAEAGFEVALLDRRGSGLNSSQRGDAPSFRRLLDDVAEFLPQCTSPRFLLGISWGGKLAAGFPRRHPGLVDGLVLIAPGLKPKIHPPLVTRLRIAFNRFVFPGRMFTIPLNDPELFTANPEKLEFIRSDPLAWHRATARFLFESARMDVYLRYVPKHIRIPVLLILAGQDRIIDNTATERFATSWATEQLDVRTYPNANHTLEFEPEGPPFLGDLAAWLRVRARSAE